MGTKASVRVRIEVRHLTIAEMFLGKGFFTRNAHLDSRWVEQRSGYKVANVAALMWLRYHDCCMIAASTFHPTCTYISLP